VREGRLEVIYGPMFSGKTDQLIARYLASGPGPAVAVKPALDDRTGAGEIRSHAGRSISAVAVGGVDELRAAVAGAAVVAVDEVQFLEPELVAAVAELASSRRVLAAGLDLDFRGEPFPATARLVAAADEATALTAVCARCGAPAARTARIRRLAERPEDEPRVAVGGAELYEPRCERCFESIRPGA
jgi:thymidine kinase